MSRKLLLLSILLLVGLLISGCPENADKHTAPNANQAPQDSTNDSIPEISLYALISGEWKGEYRLVKNNGMENETVFEQTIIAIVDSARYWLKIDTTATLTHCFCNTSGKLTITAPTIRLQSLTNVPSGGSCTACNASESPSGYFQAQLMGNTLKLTQVNSSSLAQLTFWRN